MVCRILNLWPDVEGVPPALEAQRHNQWTSRNTEHPEKSWCLHLRSSLVSSNPAWAPPSLEGPPWSIPATLSKQTTSNQHHTGDPFIWHVFTNMPISQAGMSILEDKISPFSNLKTVTTVLDTYGLTQNLCSVTFYGCDSCICGNWTPLPGGSQLPCRWFYHLISDGSLFICNWLTHLFQKEKSLKN